MTSEMRIRPLSPTDAVACGEIIFQAFKGIAERHNFPLDFPTRDAASGLPAMMIHHPSIYGVAAESEGHLIGSNFLDERDAIRGVGPISVDPNWQGHGCGRMLMEAVVERGRGARCIRLVQDAFNTTSMSLYASIGFDVKEPLALLRGTPVQKSAPTPDARPMREEDLEGCAALCRRIHGFDRINELRDAIELLKPFVLVRESRVVAYASAPTLWFLNHGVAETEQDMCDLLTAAGASADQPLALLMPLRQGSLFRWALRAGLRVLKPMNLMAMGEYHQPAGAFFPSVAY
jgi:GNAT superfamily N-acetyltransferase